MESIDIDLFDNIQQGSCDEEEVCERTKRKAFQAGKPCPAGGEGQLCIHSGSHFYREVIFIET